MKRIGGLKHQVVAGVHELTPDGRTPQQQIAACYERLREIEARQRELLPELVEELAACNIIIDSYQSLKPSSRRSCAITTSRMFFRWSRRRRSTPRIRFRSSRTCR